MAIDDAVKRLRGPKGTPVRITIVRQGYEEPLEFTVIRDEIPLHAVPYSFMVAPKVGYVRLQDFNETTACRPGEGEGCERELETALGQLKREGATAFILDIRDNPGGLLDQAFAVSNLFLKKGQLVVYTRGPHAARRVELHHRGGEPLVGRAARGADLASQRERQRDRGGGAAGPRPGAHRRRDHLRQGARADDHAAAQRAGLRARPHHRAVLHALGPLDPARLRRRPPSRSTTRPATASPATRAAARRS